MADDVIIVKDLVKVYGDLRAVDGISFEVERGEVFAFLGPNGAGKTTTVEIIETIRTATSGSVTVFGMDIQKERAEIIKRIGVLPQDFTSFDKQTVLETLVFFRDLFDSDTDVDELIKLVQLGTHRDHLYVNLSGGLKQRVGIAVALVNDPEIVFLDEPTTGLDPKARRDVWEVIRGLKEEGKTIFLTTHYMEEAEVLADYVGIISKGKIIAYGSPEELIEKHIKTLQMTFRGGKDAIVEVAGKLDMPVKNDDHGNPVVEAQDNDCVIRLLNEIKAVGAKYDSMDIRKANLEEVFLQLTGESLSEGGEQDES